MASASYVPWPSNLLAAAMGYYLVVNRFLLLVLCLATAVCSPGQRPLAQSALRLTYTFTPDAAAPASILHVTLSFQGNSMGNSRLVLPTAYAGQRDLFATVRGLKSLDHEIQIAATSDNSIRDLRYPPNQMIEIAYDLVSGTPALRSAGKTALATTESEFIFNGQNGLVHPEIEQTTAVQASFRWKGLPQDWVVISSFGNERLEEAFTGEWGKVFDAFFAAGDFRLVRLEENGENLTFATNGKWAFTDPQAAEEVMKILRAERSFWDDRRAGQFLAILTPDKQNSGVSDGTVFTGAFLFHLSRNETFGVEERSLLAHEIFHIWDPYKMGLPAGEATEWFTEGFTHYYQDRILLQSNFLSYPEYLKRLNAIVGAYWSSPDRNWTQRQWLQRTHTGDAEYALPYKRGAVLALWLDERLRYNSAGRVTLDDRMHALVDGQEKLLTAGYLITALSNGLPRQDADLFRSFVSEGKTIPLPAELLPGCATLLQRSGVNPLYEATGKAGCEDQLSFR